MVEPTDPYAPPRAPVFEPDRSGPVEDALNWLSDQDWGWWPFVRLRPARDALHTLRLSAILSLMVGVSVAPVTLWMAPRHGLSLKGAAAVAIVTFPATFVGYRISFALAWNRRARRLRAAARRA